jgi:hypothetical protein
VGAWGRTCRRDSGIEASGFPDLSKKNRGIGNLGFWRESFLVWQKQFSVFLKENLIFWDFGKTGKPMVGILGFEVPTPPPIIIIIVVIISIKKLWCQYRIMW